MARLFVAPSWERPIPQEIEETVLAAYHELGQGKVAVRSSATAEDLPGESFAGQHDTFLNINGHTELLDAARRCWASLWSERAIVYRDRQGISHGNMKMAVVVQRMVPAEVAGVLFTVNPVTGARDEMTIDAHPGLGEAVVSGMSSPDHFVLRRRFWGWAVSLRHQSKPREDADARNVTLTLDDKDLRRLATLGRAIERHFDSPQDVEWARAGDKLFIIQARPMTAVPEPPLHPGWLVRTAAGMLAEFLPERPYPLEMTTWTPVPFNALTSMVKPLGLKIPRFEDNFIQEDGIVTKYRGRIDLHITPGIALAPFRIFGLARRYDPVRWQDDPLLGKAISIPAELARRDLKVLDWQGLLLTVKDSMSIIAPFLGELRRRYLPRTVLAIVCLRLEIALLGKSRYFSTLMSGVQTKTLETNQMLEELAAMVREDSHLAGIFSNNPKGRVPLAKPVGE